MLNIDEEWRFFSLSKIGIHSIYFHYTSQCHGSRCMLRALCIVHWEKGYAWNIAVVNEPSVHFSLFTFMFDVLPFVWLIVRCCLEHIILFTKKASQCVNLIGFRSQMRSAHFQAISFGTFKSIDQEKLNFRTVNLSLVACVWDSTVLWSNLWMRSSEELNILRLTSDHVNHTSTLTLEIYWIEWNETVI